MPLDISSPEDTQTPGSNLEIGGGGDGNVDIPDNSGDLEIGDNGEGDVDLPDDSGDLEISPPSGIEIPGAKVVINLPTPMFQVVGGQIYKLLLETAASQVKMPDGVSVETRVNTLERALAANTQMHFADTIEARDKLRGLIPGDKVHVADASADETVEKGWAEYIYGPDFTFRKIAEGEGLDLIIKWEDVVGKPDSAPKDIDTAVLQQHNHTNKTELDFLSDDGADHLMFKGRRVWDGKVDVASASAEGYIPDCLRDGGLLIINPAAGGGPGAEIRPEPAPDPDPAPDNPDSGETGGDNTGETGDSGEDGGA